MSHPARLLGGAVAVAMAMAWIGVAGADGDAPFIDGTAAAGLDFRHVNGAFGGKWMPESLGSGVALFDADGDGWTDIFLVQGGPWEGHTEAVDVPLRSATMRLFRNRGDGTFEDVTIAAGLDVALYGFGAAPADYDGDGDLDLFVTAYGPNRMFRNEGGGRFTDVSDAVGLAHAGWGTSAAWLDYDRDGDLDLYLANYVHWSPDEDIWCSLDGTEKSYCTPESYVGEPSVLYRNEGDGTFIDVSREAGVFVPGGKSLGITVTDIDEDGWVDFVVANDTEPNFLFRNRQDGTFEEVGLLSGMAFDASGRARAGMGVDTADLNNRGQLSLAIGNFSKEMIGLFELQLGGVFIDAAARAGIGRSSLPFLTFSLFFFDYDLDGWLDLFATNGHLEERINEIEASITYEQRPLLYRNQGDGTLAEVGAAAQGPLSRPIVGRGAAYADLDRDGDLDVVVTTNNGPAYLFQNTTRDGGSVPHVVRFDLRMDGQNSRALGAVVEVWAGVWRQRQMVRSGSSYASQSEFVLTFGLGESQQLDGVRIRWPDGAVSEFDAAALAGTADHELHVYPTDGIVARILLQRPGS
jgi:hypothetical protein